MEYTRLQMMMLDIDGILTRHEATTADVLAAAQQMAVSAIGHLVNNGQCSARPKGACYQRDARMVNGQSLADAIAEQIRTALHARIAEGKKPDW